MGFTPSLFNKRMTERCSSLVLVAPGAAIFTQLLRRRVAFLHLTTTCRPLFKPSVSLLSTCKTIELCFEFLSHFYGFHLTLPRKTPKFIVSSLGVDPVLQTEGSVLRDLSVEVKAKVKLKVKFTL